MPVCVSMKPKSRYDATCRHRNTNFIFGTELLNRLKKRVAIFCRLLAHTICLHCHVIITNFDQWQVASICLHIHCNGTMYAEWCHTSYCMLFGIILESWIHRERERERERVKYFNEKFGQISTGSDCEASREEINASNAIDRWHRRRRHHEKINKQFWAHMQTDEDNAFRYWMDEVWVCF